VKNVDIDRDGGGVRVCKFINENIHTLLKCVNVNIATHDLLTNVVLVTSFDDWNRRPTSGITLQKG